MDTQSLKVVAHFISTRFYLSPKSAFVFNNGGKLNFILDHLDGKIPIQSGRITISEDKIIITLFYEFSHKSKEECGRIIAKLNDIFKNHCLGTCFIFRQEKDRKFLGKHLTLSIPNTMIEEKSLNSHLVNNVLSDFFDDYVGYAWHWQDTPPTNYESRCIKPLPVNQKFYYLSQLSMMGDILNKNLDDITGEDLDRLLR